MTSVRNRILFFFTLFALGSCLAVYMGTRSTLIIGGAANSVANDHLPLVYALGEMDVALQRQDNSLYHYLLSGDKQWLDIGEKERINYTRWFLKAQEGQLQDIELDKLNEVDELYNQYDNLA